MLPCVEVFVHISYHDHRKVKADSCSSTSRVIVSTVVGVGGKAIRGLREWEVSNRKKRKKRVIIYDQ